MRLPESNFFVDGLWRCTLFGEFTRLWNFEMENLQMEYSLQLPDGWVHRQMSSQPYSYRCRVNSKGFAHLSLPFNFDFYIIDEGKLRIKSLDKMKKEQKEEDEESKDTSGSQDKSSSVQNGEADQEKEEDKVKPKNVSIISWPRLCICVHGYDTFGRKTLLGTATEYLPQTAGQHILTMYTCRKVSDRHLDQLSQHFLGFVEDHEEPTSSERDVIHTYPTRTETSGQAEVRVQCILRSAESIEKRAEERELLSASIDEVVAAFEKAKLHMMQLRQKIALPQV